MIPDALSASRAHTWRAGSTTAAPTNGPAVCATTSPGTAADTMANEHGGVASLPVGFEHISETTVPTSSLHGVDLEATAIGGSAVLV